MRASAVPLLAVFLTACATPHRLECVAHGGQPVLRIESDHFQVTGEFPEALLALETRKLELLWDAWVAFFGANPATTGKLQVVLARQGASSEFVDDSAGFVRYAVPARLFSTLYTVSSPGGRETAYASTNAHELVHLVTVFWLPRQPRWIAEGLAGYLEDAEFISYDVVRMGRWKQIRSQGLSVATLEELWAWDLVRETGDRQTDLYDSAWAWVHYLNNKDEVRLAKLWKALATQPSAKDAFASVFPPAEWKSLHQRVEAYVEAARFRGWQTTLPREPQLSPVRTLEPWEVHLLRRELLEAEGSRRAETRQARALVTGPEPAELTLATYEEHRGPLRSEVLAVLPEDPRAFRVAAGSPDVSPSQRFSLIERAANQAPSDANAQDAFCWAALDRNDKRALAAGERAIALAPWWTSPYLCRESSLARQGRCAEAHAVLDQLVGLVVDGDASLLRRINAERKHLTSNCKATP